MGARQEQRAATTLGACSPPTLPRSRRRRRLPSMLAMTAVVGVLGATGMLIAARKTIDSVDRVPRRQRTSQPRWLSDRELPARRLRQPCWGRSRRCRRGRHRHRSRRVGSPQRHDHDPAARQVHRRRRRCLSIPRDLWVQVAGSRRQAAHQLGVQRRTGGAGRDVAAGARPSDPPLRRDRLLGLQVAGRFARRRADLLQLRDPRRQHRA